MQLCSDDGCQFVGLSVPELEVEELNREDGGVHSVISSDSYLRSNDISQSPWPSVNNETSSTAAINMRDFVEPIDAVQLSRLLTDSNDETASRSRPQQQQSSSPILIDCRPYLAFSAAHIVNAHNVCHPSILQRRRQRQLVELKSSSSQPPIPLENIVRCSDVRQALISRKYDAVVAYDERSSCILSENNKDKSVKSMNSSEQLLSVLRSLSLALPLQRLFYLKGGFSDFASVSPELLRSEQWQSELLMTEQCSSSRPVSRQSHHTTPTDTVRCHPSADQSEPVEVLPWLYLGNAYHASCDDRLTRLKISALLSVADVQSGARQMTTELTEQPHFCYINLQVADSTTAEISRCFPQAIDFIESVRQSGGKVLVHCLAGISRSATICIAYLMYSGRLSLDQAHDYLKFCRPLISPNLNFMRQLAEYQKHLSRSDDSSDSKLYQLVTDVISNCPGVDLLSSASPRHSIPHNGRLTAANSTRLQSLSKRLEHLDATVSAICNNPLSRDKLAETVLRNDIVADGSFRKRGRGLTLPCASAAAKMAKIGVNSGNLQPPQTPSTKQTFAFDFPTVGVMMMAGYSQPAVSPTICHSPLVSPS